mgnify:CR=1 FL=1
MVLAGEEKGTASMAIPPSVPLVEKRQGRLHVHKPVAVRLQPVRFGDRVVFIDRNQNEAGYVCLTLLSDYEELYIDYFEVKKPFRGRGYGRKMYEWIETYARRRGMKRIILTPFNSSTSFWARMGFRLILRQRYDMVKTLK